MSNLYKVIIVDDEYVIRDGLMSFKWERLGFTPSGSASDGEEALKLMEADPADLIITDIKMPIMDGIELSEKVSSMYPACKIVILTGYKEFDYVQKAIKSGVIEYLLKPIDLFELERLILKIKDNLDAEHQAAELIESYQKRLKESLPLAAENLLRRIVEEKVTNLLEIEESMNLLEIYLERPFYSCAVLRINVPEEYESRLEQINTALSACLNEQINVSSLGHFYFDSLTEAVILFNFELEDNKEPTFDFLTMQTEKICNAVKDTLKKEGLPYPGICMGIGNIYNNILYLSLSYRQACNVLQRRFFNEKAETFYAWKEKISYLQIMSNYPYDKENLLINATLDGNKEQCLEFLNSFWDDLMIIQNRGDPNHFKNAINQLLSMLERRLVKHGTTLREIADAGSPFMEFIDRSPTVSRLRESIQQLFMEACDAITEINNSVKSSSHAAVKEAIKYINEHYNEKITLNELADRVFLNSSYLGIQFKKETGRNFVNYIKEVRIEKAKELLKGIDMKVYEISEIIGYQDYKYFREVFKALTGLTPLEYRQKLISQ